MSRRLLFAVVVALLSVAGAADAAAVAAPPSAPKCPPGASVAVTSLTFDPATALAKMTVTITNKGAVPLPLGRVGAAVYGPTKNADGSPVYDGTSGIDCGANAAAVAPNKSVTCRWALVGGGKIGADGRNDDSGVDKGALAAARAFSPGAAAVSYLLAKGLEPGQVAAAATLYQSNDFMGPQGFACGPSPRRVASRA